jgi:hypothetical protein
MRSAGALCSHRFARRWGEASLAEVVLLDLGLCDVANLPSAPPNAFGYLAVR